MNLPRTRARTSVGTRGGPFAREMSGVIAGAIRSAVVVAWAGGAINTPADLRRNSVSLRGRHARVPNTVADDRPRAGANHRKKKLTDMLRSLAATPCGQQLAERRISVW